MLDDFAIFQRKWQAARPRDQHLPPYEELMLGSLGRSADQVMLIEGHCAETFRILRAGRKVEEFVGCSLAEQRVASLPPDFSKTLSEALLKALRSERPASLLAHCVREGMVETYEVLALPMASRWGPPLLAVSIRRRAGRHNLVDAVFRSTEKGILALAPVTDIAGNTADFRVLACNDGAVRLLQAKPGELNWRCLSDLQNGPLDKAFVEQINAGSLGTGPDRFEAAIARPDGELHLQVSVATVGSFLSVTMTDIREVKQREASFRLLFDSNPVPMWLYDPETLQFVSVNDAAVSHYGYSRERFVAMTLLDVCPREDWELHGEVARNVGDAYQSDRTWRHIKSDGSVIEVLTYARRVTFSDRQAVLVAIVDVTERKQAEARVAFMAHHDALTQLPNRTRFHQRLDEALGSVRRPGEALAVHCIDLDHFKPVNDTLGHPIGDQLLQAVADRLQRCIRETDLVARLGGDEFAVVQCRTTPHEAGVLAGRIIEAVSAPYQIQGHEVIIGASVGVALAPNDGESSDALLRNADIALYCAKTKERGTSHFFEPDMDRQIQARRKLELDLRKAFANGEFELHYQPQIDLCRNEISGFEALLRWRHPDRGMVLPADFIPVAEEIGLIVPLGEWVLQQACAEAARWPGHLRVAVNLSPMQFRGRGLVQIVLGALERSRLPADRLDLEITETVLLRETEANLAILHELRMAGVRISMDDFGTGYSSLSYLRSFPFDKLKIDHSFVRDLTKRPDCLAIVRAIAGLAASLNISTTAEGVETREQLDRLRAEGCAEAQGFYFGEARPAADLAQMLAKQRPAIAEVA